MLRLKAEKTLSLFALHALVSRMTPNARHLLAVVVLFMSAKLVSAASAELGIFSRQRDIGNVARPGSANFDPARGEYRVAGGGENMWFTNDAFHFVWTRMSGNFTLTADVKFIGTGGNPHRKACLLIRQSLKPGSVYADVALHGVGLTALQYRDAPNAPTHEIQSNISAPARMRIEKRGDYISMWLAAAGEELKPAGGYLRIPFKGKCYVGLGVCAHDNKAIEQAVFSNVELKPVATPADAQPVLESTLETVTVASSDRSVIYRTRDHIEAPNWSHDGKFFLFNGGGRIWRLPVTGGTAEALDTGSQIHCNNDHGLSPDGAQLAISDQTQGGKSRIYVLPVSGGTPRLVTPLAPSYWHGWSPDGKTLAYCAERNSEFDVYTMPAAGGAETRLTTAPGLDDGPEYSPDGKYIYFNSERKRSDADLADETGWFRAGTNHLRRLLQLVPAPVAQRPVAGFPFLRQGCERPSRQQGRDAPTHVTRGRENSGARKIIWRAGHDQRPIVVAGQPECGLRQLSNGVPVNLFVILKADKNVTHDDNMPLPGFLRVQPDGILLSVKLQPRASRNEIAPPLGDELKIKVTAPPVDAAANEALVELLAEKLDCARNRIELVRGHKSRHKAVKLYGFKPEEVLRRISPTSSSAG